MFQATMCPTLGEITYLCDTGICHSVWVASGLLIGVKLHSVWVASGLLVGVSLQPADWTPPIKSDKYQCCIGTVISPDDGHMVARNM